MDYVRDLVIVCAVGAVAAGFVPSRAGRGVRNLTFVLVALTAVSPLAGIVSKDEGGFDFGVGTEAPAADALSYEDAVLEQTASAIASYVRDTLDEKFGVRSGVRISVLFDDSSDSLTLTEIQIFCGVRFDSYRDREIEEELSDALGCDVFVFSE